MSRFDRATTPTGVSMMRIETCCYMTERCDDQPEYAATMNGGVMVFCAKHAALFVAAALGGGELVEYEAGARN